MSSTKAFPAIAALDPPLVQGRPSAHTPLYNFCRRRGAAVCS